MWSSSTPLDLRNVTFLSRGSFLTFPSSRNRRAMVSLSSAVSLPASLPASVVAAGVASASDEAAAELFSDARCHAGMPLSSESAIACVFEVLCRFSRAKWRDNGGCGWEQVKSRKSDGIAL